MTNRWKAFINRKLVHSATHNYTCGWESDVWIFHAPTSWFTPRYHPPTYYKGGPFTSRYYVHETEKYWSPYVFHASLSGLEIRKHGVYCTELSSYRRILGYSYSCFFLYLIPPKLKSVHVYQLNMIFYALGLIKIQNIHKTRCN